MDRFDPQAAAGLVACPVCGRRFKDSHGRGGHLATLNDPAHAAYRASKANPPHRDSADSASSTGPSAVEGSYDLQAWLRDLAALQHSPDNPRRASTEETTLEASPRPPPSTPQAQGSQGPGLALLTLMGGALTLAGLVRARQGSPPSPRPSQPSARPSPQVSRRDLEHEAYWRGILGPGAIDTKRRRFP